MTKGIFSRMISLYGLMLLLSIADIVFCIGNILTHRTIVEYDQQTKVKYFQIDFSLESNIVANNYIKLIFPLTLHKISQTSIYAVLKKSVDTTQPTAAQNVYSLANTGTNEYTFANNYDLVQGTFYSILVYVEQITVFGWFSQGIIISAVSDNYNPIIYAKNANSGSFFVNTPLTSVKNDSRYFSVSKFSPSDQVIQSNLDIGISQFLGINSSAVAPFDTMGIKYWLLVYIKADFNTYNSAFFRFSIDSPGNAEFILLNYCKVIQIQMANGALSSSCRVDLIENYLEIIVLGDISYNDEFQIVVGIQNAYLQIQSDVSLVIGNSNTKQVGTSMQIDSQRVIKSYRQLQSALITKAIELQIERLNLFFGVSYNYLENNFPLGVFQSLNSAAIPVYNSLSLSFHSQQSFQLPNNKPIRAILVVTPATEILSLSIKTNLEPITGGVVYCKYINSLIICDNINRLLANKRYFISFKAFFDENVKQNQFVNFCSLVFQEYNPTAQRQSFIQTQGYYVKLFQNNDLRDLSPNGWHSQAFEHTSVVSAPEKPTLKEIYDNVYSTTTGSVGITPDQNEQSILFLIKATEKDYCNSNLSLCSNDYINVLYFRTTILFNYNVIKFSAGRENYGIDFAAMNSSGQLDQASFRCLANNYCDKYDQFSIKNTKKLLLKDNTITDEVSMGLVFFDCGVLQKDLDPGVKPSAVANCLNLKGKGTTVGSNGILALRNVRFDAKFKSTSFFADDTVLDFVITFMRGIMVNSLIPSQYDFISTYLINGYTIQRQQLSTVKAGYINYYIDTANAYNNGYDIPVLFRLGGSFPSTITSGVTKVVIFLDESIDFTSFYWSKSTQDYVEKPYLYGCSEKECSGYKVKRGGSMDAYHLHNTIVVQLNPTTDISQPFNIIVPMANYNQNILPFRVAVGLIDDSGTMKTVFRLVGPPALGDTTLTTPSPVLQGLAPQTTPYTFPFQPAPKKFTYAADGSGVKSSSTGTLLLKAVTDTSVIVQGNKIGLWGAGLTVVSRNQDIFTSSRSSISFRNHPGSFKQCTLATYNLVNHPLGNGLDGYYQALYCPVDDENLTTDFFKTDKSDVININTPFSYFWGSNLKLSNILSYSLSNNNGLLLGSFKEANIVTAPTSNMQKCIIDQTMNVIQPNSKGKQVLIIPISFNQDYYFDPLYLQNIPSFMIEITFSDVVTGFVLDGSYCFIKGYLNFQDYFDCYPTWTDSKVARMKLKAKQQFIFQKGSPFSIELQVNENFGVNFDKTSVVYSVNIMLPDAKSNPKDNIPSIFTSPDTIKVITESCTGGSLQLGSVPLDNQLEIKNLKTKFINDRARGYLKVDFSILSTRYRVNKGSSFFLELGFFKDQNMNDNQRMDSFNCYVLQQLKSALPATPFETSFFFSKVIYTGISLIQVILKNDLNDPQLYQFQLVCLNMRIPTNTYKGEQMKMNFMDIENIEYFVSTLNISYTDLNFASTKQNLFMEITSWSGYTEGQFTNYLFRIQNVLDTEINQFTRIFANFPAIFNNNLSESINCKQNDQTVTCMIDPTDPRTLQIQLNQGPIAVGDYFTLQINNLANSQIDPSVNGVYFCLISDFRIQIDQSDFIQCGFQGIVPLYVKQSATSVKQIEIRRIWNNGSQQSSTNVLQQQTYVKQFYLGKDQVFVIDMEIAQGVFDYRNYLLVELPALFSQYILDNDYVACEITTASRQDNLSFGCSYYNQRYIKVQLVKDPQNFFASSVYRLYLYKIYIPEQITGMLADQIFFNILVYDFALQNMLAYSYSNCQNPLNFVTDNTIAHLQWQNSDSYTIYQGYYKSKFTLSPQDNTIFLSQFTMMQSVTNTNLIFNTKPLLGTIGDSSTSFQISGADTSLIGYYNIDFLKSSSENKYQRVPRLRVNLSNNPCILDNTFDQILIVQDGQMVVPIILDDCIPLNSFQIKATIIDPTNSGIFKFTDSSQISIVDVQIGQLRAFFEVKCDQTATPDSTLQLKIEILNNSYYLPNPTNIIFKVQSSTQQVSNPQPDPINFSSQVDNYINISIGCDQPGYIVWIAGASNLNYEQYDSAYMYEQMVVQKKQKSCGATKDYCYDFFMMNKPVMSFQVLVPNLISRQLYYFQYFCRNQIGMFSNERSFTFKAADNLGRMNKITLQLNKVVTTTASIQSVLCFVSEQLVANYMRVVDANNLSCLDQTLYSTTIKRVPDQILYIYIIPLYTATLDKTTTNVQQLFSSPLILQSTITSINAQIGDYKTEFYDDQYIPDYTITQFTLQKSSLTMQVNFKTISGYFIIGFITISESLPQKEQFLNSLNYLNQPIPKIQKHFIPKGLSRDIEFTFDNLVQEGRIYNTLFIAVPDNPQFSIDYASDLQNKTFTIPKSQVDINVDPNNQTTLSLLLSCHFMTLIIIYAPLF